MALGLVRGLGTADKIPEELRVLQVENPGERVAFGVGSARVVLLEPAQQDEVKLLHAAPAAPAQPGDFAVCGLARVLGRRAQCCRSAIIFLISAMARAGFRSFGQASAQFMIVWQR